ncbi:MAG: mandelate racemase/muconate lactonizing enzyme family protein, partial [Dehalococcoidia bacterium]|nr:mandelate racemase/muconate lactonizing enzyme family protein [Dehalococcoidia bacterium]
MKITAVKAIPMSDPIPPEHQHRTDLGTKIKSDNVMVLVETDEGLTGIGASLGNPAVVVAAINTELGPEIIGENPMFSERIYEK